MANGILIYGFVISTIAIGLFIWLIYLVTKQKEDYENDPIAINFMAHRSNGRAIGVEKQSIIGKNGRYLNIISPRDVDERNNEKIKDSPTVIVDNRKVITLPKGTLSRDRDIKIYLPKNPEDLPESLKQTEFGKFLMNYIEYKNIISAEIKTLREGSDRKDHILDKMGDQVFNRVFIENVEATMKDVIRSMSKEDKVKGKPTLTPSSTISGNM